MKKVCIILAAVMLVVAAVLAGFAFSGEGIYQARSHKYAGVQNAVIAKNYQGNYAAMSEQESDAVVNYYGGFAIARIYTNNSGGSLSIRYGGIGSGNLSFSGCISADKEFTETFGLGLVAGKLPAGDNELCITLYEYEFYKNYGYVSSPYDPKDKTVAAYEDIIGKIIEINDIEFTITGILDTSLDDRIADEAMSGSAIDGVSKDWKDINEHIALYLSPQGMEDVFEFAKYTTNVGSLEVYACHTAPLSLADARGADIVWAEGADTLNADGIILSKDIFRKLMYLFYGDHAYGSDFEGERYTEETLDDGVLKAMLDAGQNTKLTIEDKLYIKGYWDNQSVMQNHDAVINDAVYAYKTEELYNSKETYVTSILARLGKNASKNAVLFEAFDMGNENTAYLANSVYEPYSLSRRTIEQIAFGAALAGSAGFFALTFKKKWNRNKW